VLASLFMMGQRLSNPFKVRGVESGNVAFNGKRFPEYFKFKGKEVGQKLGKHCHRNMRFQLTFETDAENDYFRREIEPGAFQLLLLRNGSRTIVENLTGPVLHDGIANLRVYLPPDCSIGEDLEYCAVVTDESRVDPIENYCTVYVEADIDPAGGNGGRRKPPTPNPGKDRELLTGIAFPKIKDVRREEWDKHQFDGYSALRIVNSGEAPVIGDANSSSVYDFYVNIDNIYIQHELKASKKEPKVLRARFRFGLVLLGLGVLQQHIKEESEASHSDESAASEYGTPDIEARVEAFTKAVAPVLLPMIDGLGALNEDEFEVLGDSGEDL